MAKPNYFGVGPRIARVLLPWLAATILISLFYPTLFTFPASFQPWLLIFGAVWLLPGVIFYAISGKMMTKAVKEGRLITSGPYRYSRNPLYAMVILNIIPGIGLMMNSWLVLTTTIAGYLVFKRCIRGEYEEMSALFGETYRDYSHRTPEFFPWCPSRR